MNISQEELISGINYAVHLIGSLSFNIAEPLLHSLLISFRSDLGPSMLETAILNNLSLIYIRTNSSYRSIPLLSRAALFCPSSHNEINILVGAHINLCAMNSALGFHKVALQNSFRALEVSENLHNFEITALIHYNIGCQLGLLEKQEKAHEYFREAYLIAKRHLGPNHKLTILTEKAEEIQNGVKYHFRIASSSFNSKNASFSSSGKVTRYGNLTAVNHDYKFKMNLSSKIASVYHTGRNLISNLTVPIVKEFRISKKTNVSAYASPKTPKRKIGELERVYTAAKSGVPQKVKKRLRAIKGHLLFLESKLKEFVQNSEKVAKSAQIENYRFLSQINAALTIQHWYRKVLKKLN